MNYSLKDLQEITHNYIVMRNRKNIFYIWLPAVENNDWDKLELIDIWPDDLELEVKYNDEFWNKYINHKDIYKQEYALFTTYELN